MNENKIMYKVFDKGLTSPYQKMKYQLNKWYTCEDMDMDVNNECSKGFYAVDIDGLIYWFGKEKPVYLVEVSGRRVEIDVKKKRYERIRIIKRLNESELIEHCQKVESKLGYRLSEVLYHINPLKIIQ